MKIEEARKLKTGQTVYLPATVRWIENNGNEISLSVCYAGRFGRTTSDIRAYYEQLVLPLTHREIQLILNALDGYVLDCPATHELLEKLEVYRKEQK
jgi:hypothetical protein